MIKSRKSGAPGVRSFSMQKCLSCGWLVKAAPSGVPAGFSETNEGRCFSLPAAPTQWAGSRTVVIKEEIRARACNGPSHSGTGPPLAAVENLRKSCLVMTLQLRRLTEAAGTRERPATLLRLAFVPAGVRMHGHNQVKNEHILWRMLFRLIVRGSVEYRCVTDSP